jgi:hypothetical protein
MSLQTLASLTDIARRGEDIYENQLRASVETDVNVGRILALDVYSGDFEIGEDKLALAERVRARHTDAEVYFIRIGYDTAEAMGARLQRRPPTAANSSSEQLLIQDTQAI